MAASRQLAPEELLQVKWALGSVLALLSVSAVAIFDLGGLWLLPPVAVAILATALRPAWSGRIPATAWRLAVPALLLFIAADWYFTREVLSTLIRLNVLLITIRAVAPRKRREDQQLVVLCLLLLVVAGVLTVSLGFAVVMLAFASLALVFQLLVTLTHAALADQAPPATWMRVDWSQLGRRLWAALDGRLAALAAGLFLIVVALTAGLFAALPRFRIENAVGFLSLQTKKSFTGFSETVNIGDVTDISEDTTTAVRVEISDPTQASTQLYWRMVALDAYENGTFRVSRVMSAGDRPVRSSDRWIEGQDFGRAAEGAPDWTIYLEPGVTRFLPLAGPFRRLTMQERQPLVVNAYTGAVALRSEPQKLFAYRVEAMADRERRADPRLAALLTNPPRRLLRVSPQDEKVTFPQTLLALPAGDSAARVLQAQVQQITGGAQLDAAEFSRRARAQLAQRHRYAMRSALPKGDGDPFVRWIDSDTPGHCELFAGAFALLARQAGFPTRLVTGFRGGVWNDFENYLMLRNADAHAWCELYDPAAREWLRVDPTPAGAGARDVVDQLAGAGRKVDRSWSARLDSLRLLWYRRVINFDQTTQAETAATLRDYGRDLMTAAVKTADHWRDRLKAWLEAPWSGERAGGFIAGAFLVAALVWFTRRWRTRWRWRRAERRGRIDPIRAEAGRWLARFSNLPAATAAESESVTRELRRLRFGPPGTAARADQVFLHARREWRAARRRKQRH